LSKAFYQNQKTEMNDNGNDISVLSEEIKKRVLFDYPYRELSKMLSSETGRNPMIIPFITDL
jgi:hypothetical protein